MIYTNNNIASPAATYNTVLLAIQPYFATKIPIKAVASVSPKIYWKKPIKPVEEPTANFGTTSLTTNPTRVKALSAQSYHVTTLGATVTISLDIQNERAYHVIYHSKKDLANI